MFFIVWYGACSATRSTVGISGLVLKIFFAYRALIQVRKSSSLIQEYFES